MLPCLEEFHLRWILIGAVSCVSLFVVVDRLFFGQSSIGFLWFLFSGGLLPENFDTTLKTRKIMKFFRSPLAKRVFWPYFKRTDLLCFLSYIIGIKVNFLRAGRAFLWFHIMMSL